MDDYAYFVDHIKNITGIDLSFYKEQQMRRRLLSLSNKHGCRNLVGFSKAIEKSPELLEKFLNHMTINVSEFFRNQNHWKILEEMIAKGALNKNKLKVWSAACSTGEEPYSLGILLSKYLNPSDLSILATDIDQTVLNKAKVGTYHKNSLEGLDSKLIDKYFHKGERDFYELNKKIKQLVTFKKGDLLTDRFQKNFDLIVCRNVMIYFNEDAKNHLYQKFSQSLTKGGVLFVGSTEQLFNPAQYGLKSVSSFFYQKI
ncbi:CheR family methyltransferase [Lentibacillus salinarum]|uniref:CheR family methyltransferase n=1 Tax=Lentibacillus salinarum TaxID=446820 RepID=A0ABW3ZQI8_9BACI